MFRFHSGSSALRTFAAIGPIDPGTLVCHAADRVQPAAITAAAASCIAGVVHESTADQAVVNVSSLAIYRIDCPNGSGDFVALTPSGLIRTDDPARAVAVMTGPPHLHCVTLAIT